MNSLRDVFAGLVTVLSTVPCLAFGVMSAIAAARWMIDPSGSVLPVCHVMGLWAGSAVMLMAWAATLAR